MNGVAFILNCHFITLSPRMSNKGINPVFCYYATLLDFLYKVAAA